MKPLLPWILASSTMLCGMSCKSRQETALETAPSPSLKSPSKTCRLEEIRQSTPKVNRVIRMAYDAGLLKTVTASTAGNPQPISLAYHHDDEGRLDTVDMGETFKLTYVREGDRLTAIESTGPFLNQLMVMNEEGQVTEQRQADAENTYITTNFRFEGPNALPKTCPSYALVRGDKGQTYYEAAFEYDEGMNPLTGLTRFLNQVEEDFGYGAGTCSRNLVKATMVFKTAWIDRMTKREWQPGEVRVIRRTIETDRDGLPQTIQTTESETTSKSVALEASAKSRPKDRNQGTSPGQEQEDDEGQDRVLETLNLTYNCS